MLKAKVDAGATRAITQFFFENDLYFRYLDRVRARGIDIPIVPGILPVQNFKQTTSFRRAQRRLVPAWLAERFEGLDDDRGDPQADRRRGRRRAGASTCVDRGVTDFHFYTMNRADLVYAICHLLGLRPRAGNARAAAECGNRRQVTSQSDARQRPDTKARTRASLATPRASASSCSTAPWAR